MFAVTVYRRYELTVITRCNTNVDFLPLFKVVEKINDCIMPFSDFNVIKKSKN